MGEQCQQIIHGVTRWGFQRISCTMLNYEVRLWVKLERLERVFVER